MWRATLFPEPDRPLTMRMRTQLTLASAHYGRKLVNPAI